MRHAADRNHAQLRRAGCIDLRKRFGRPDLTTCPHEARATSIMDVSRLMLIGVLAALCWLPLGAAIMLLAD